MLDYHQKKNSYNSSKLISMKWSQKIKQYLRSRKGKKNNEVNNLQDELTTQNHACYHSSRKLNSIYVQPIIIFNLNIYRDLNKHET